MKKSLLFLLIFSSFLSYSQKKEFRVITKSNKEYIISNFIAKRKFIKLKYNNQAIQLNYEDLEKIDVNYLNEKHKELNHSVVYIKFSKKFGGLVKILVEGKCNLYSNSEFAFGGGTSTALSVLRENEVFVTQLCDENYTFLLNFKKNASKYFKDCDVLVEKIQNEEYKCKQVIDVVGFYNSNCK